MKLTTAFALVSLAFAGAACSEQVAQEEEAPVVESETVAVDDEFSGSFNLSLPSSLEEDQASSGGLNLRLGQDSQNDGIIVGASGFGGGNFEDAPSLEIDLSEEDTDGANVSVPKDEDDVIRLDP